MRSKLKNIQKEKLQDLYLNKGYSIKMIGEKYNMSDTPIKRMLDEYGIPRRANYSFTKPIRKRMSKGRIRYFKTKKGLKHREKLSKLHKGWQPENIFKKGNTPWNKGKRCPQFAGENNPAFNNWSSREPYGKEFNPDLKEEIRKLYHYRCQECFRHQEELEYKLHIHHIDFNKQNNNILNLIPLCRNCHQQTQFNREEWTKYFQDKVMV